MFYLFKLLETIRKQIYVFNINKIHNLTLTSRLIISPSRLDVKVELVTGHGNYCRPFNNGVGYFMKTIK